MTKTEKITTRIEELEKELEEKFADIAKFKNDLAIAYADGKNTEGKNTEGILKNLTESRNASQGILAALGSLDRKLYDVQTAENSELAEKLDDEINKRFVQSVKAAGKALKPLKANLAETIPAGQIPGLLEKITGIIKKEIWNVLDAEASDRYSVEVPALPAAVQSRDDRGQRVEKPLDRLPFGQVVGDR